MVSRTTSGLIRFQCNLRNDHSNVIVTRAKLAQLSPGEYIKALALEHVGALPEGFWKLRYVDKKEILRNN